MLLTNYNIGIISISSSTSSSAKKRCNSVDSHISDKSIKHGFDFSFGEDCHLNFTPAVGSRHGYAQTSRGPTPAVETSKT
jgi:hypothetical protein